VEIQYGIPEGDSADIDVVTKTQEGDDGTKVWAQMTFSNINTTSFTLEKIIRQPSNTGLQQQVTNCQQLKRCPRHRNYFTSSFST